MLNPLPYDPSLRKCAFENIAGKGENFNNQPFSFSLIMILTPLLHIANFNIISVTVFKLGTTGIKNVFVEYVHVH